VTPVPSAVFDVDGVLVDSYPAYRRIWSRWATLRYLDPDVVWSHTHGRRPVDTITVVAPHLDADAEYRLIREIMAAEGGAFPAYPDAAAVLSLLAGHRWEVDGGAVPGEDGCERLGFAYR